MRSGEVDSYRIVRREALERFWAEIKQFVKLLDASNSHVDKGFALVLHHVNRCDNRNDSALS
jgi:hypothetical protein